MTEWIDTWAYTNRLNFLPPVQKMGFGLVMLILALVSQPMTQVGIMVWMAVWAIAYAQIPLTVYLKLLLGGSTFICMSSLALLIDIPHWSISLEAVDIFLQLGLRALSSLTCFFFLLLTIPLVEIVRVLRQCRFPEILLELMLLMYRFIWRLQDTVMQIQLAQKARGGYDTFTLKLKSLSLLIRELLHRTLREYQQFSWGAIARGFDHKFRFLSTQKYWRSLRYEIEAAIGIFLLVILDLYQNKCLRP